ncbi:MAG: response regulator [Treponema sp.]|nr:response regulator [Treponema sp.]
MNIIAVDDEKLILKEFRDTIKEVIPDCTLSLFFRADMALEYAENNLTNIAFLDVEMPGMNGIDLARRLREINSETNIIFVTSHEKYSLPAFSVHASGFLVKPFTSEDITKEMKNLRRPVDRKSDVRIYAQTFGNFEVFSYGNALKFSRSKTKELFAYLIDRNGASASTRELCALLWEDKQDTPNLMSYLRKLIADLTKTLRSAGLDDIIVRRYNSIAVVPEKIVCDSYGFMKGDPRSLNAYRGQYMAQYSWAEITNGIMDNVQLNYKRLANVNPITF